MQIGLALGLFAIFGIIRYRTNAIPIKEMTYLFIIIAISVINALANNKISYAELIFTNIVIVLLVYLLEHVFLLRHEAQKVVYYEKIDLIKPEKRKELIEDLQDRTGLKINRIEINKIDFLKDSAVIYIYYFEDENMLSGFYNEENDDDDDD